MEGCGSPVPAAQRAGWCGAHVALATVAAAAVATRGFGYKFLQVSFVFPVYIWERCMVLDG